MGVQISDSLGTVKPWSQYICNLALLNNQVMPPRKEFDAPNVVGGYVREPVVGKHKWTLSADVNSMYPLLGMVGFNMSPETLRIREVGSNLFQVPDKIQQSTSNNLSTLKPRFSNLFAFSL